MLWSTVKSASVPLISTASSSTKKTTVLVDILADLAEKLAGLAVVGIIVLTEHPGHDQADHDAEQYCQHQTRDGDIHADLYTGERDRQDVDRRSRQTRK